MQMGKQRWLPHPTTYTHTQIKVNKHWRWTKTYSQEEQYYTSMNHMKEKGGIIYIQYLYYLRILDDIIVPCYRMRLTAIVISRFMEFILQLRLLCHMIWYTLFYNTDSWRNTTVVYSHRTNGLTKVKWFSKNYTYYDKGMLKMLLSSF